MALAGNDPLSNPGAWNVLVVAGVTSPGYCVVKEHSRKNEWDIKKGKGAKGATITFVQRPPAQFSVEFYAGYVDASGAGGADHFAAWDVFQLLLRFDPTKKTPNAIDVYHPALADLEITSVVTEDIGGWEDVGDKLFRRTVKLLEYAPPPAKSATGSPTGSKSQPGQIQGPGAPKPPPPPAPDANQSAEDILKQLQDQAKQQ